MGKLVNVVQDGKTFAIPEEQVADAVRQGFHVEGDEEAAARVQGDVNQDRFGGIGGKVVAGTLGIARGATLGLSDAALRAAGVDPEELRTIRDVNPLTSTITEIGGALATGGTNLPAGIATRIGTRAAHAAEGAGIATQIARAGRGAAIEGGIVGAGQGVSELALSDDPLTVERVASVMGSNMLFGAGTGGVAGVATKGLQVGLSRAKQALDDVAARPIGALGEVSDDLAKLDRKGLRAAEQAELEAIEASRVAKRAEVADEIKALRSEMKEKKLWLATKDADVKAIKEVREIGKVAFEADKSIDRMLRNPKALAARPQRVLDGLQQQEDALERLVKQGDQLRPIFAADGSGARAAALDYAQVALEKNRALQAKIGELTAKPTSQRLTQIADAADALSAPKPTSFAGELLQGSVFGHVAGAFSGLPVVGPMLGAKAARLVSDLIGGKLGAASTEAAARGSKAIGAFLDVTRKVQPAAPIVASKVLSSVRYSLGQEEKRGKREKAAKSKPPSLTESYKARAEELRSAVVPQPDGSVQTRPTVRKQIAAKLAPIAAAAPALADRLETLAARRIEFLASKLPKRPDVGGLPIGPDKWQPSDMEMRAFARYVAAVEDPNGVVERLTAGSITPEDVEAIKGVYPELHADITRQIIERLPELRRTLPFQRRIALSMFTGVAVDPTLDPRVLSVLQRSFEREQGTEGGIQAPRPQPQFGSVSREQPTPSQERQA